MFCIKNNNETTIQTIPSPELLLILSMAALAALAFISDLKARWKRGENSTVCDGDTGVVRHQLTSGTHPYYLSYLPTLYLAYMDTYLPV